MRDRSPTWVRLPLSSVLPLGMLCLLGGGQAHAEDEGDGAAAVSRPQCFARHEAAQVARRDGHLLDARTALRACSHSACPDAIRADCVEWLDQVERSVPSVVIAARVRGVDEANVRVLMDDGLVTEHLTGAALEIDPGPHRFRLESPPWPAIDLTILVSAGVKNRTVDVEFAPAVTDPGRAQPVAKDGNRSPDRPATTALPLTRPPSALPLDGENAPDDGRHFRLAETFLLAGAVVGLGGFATFGALAVRERHDLQDRCAPFCSSAEVDGLRTKLVVADVALGVTVASLAAALYLYLTRSEQASHHGNPRSPLANSGAGAMSLSITPAAPGGELMLAGRF